MILTVDPVSVIPAFGMKLSAWLSVHLIASDYTTSGADPEFAIFGYNFPPELSSQQKEEYVRSIGDECNKLGISIAGGHTGSYPGGGFTVIGAGTMFGFADDGAYVTPAMAKAGDVILMTKHAAIEATASLARSFPRYIECRLGRRIFQRASELIRLSSTVKDARTARIVGLGGRDVTSMHDATEGGVLGALNEMATASGKLFQAGYEVIPISEEATEVCKIFGLDPLRTMGEGALLLTCGPEAASSLEGNFSRAGIPLSRIGEVKNGSGLILTGEGGQLQKYRPGHDRYWKAYGQAVRLKLG
jgi:hydrogenase maturation factor